MFAFTRAGDDDGAGASRASSAPSGPASSGPPPEELDAAIIFAPAGELVPAALAAVAKGGAVVCAGIHMSDIPSFSYELLWGERVVRSVANLTRRDGEEFLALAPRCRCAPRSRRSRSARRTRRSHGCGPATSGARPSSAPA